MRVRDLRGLLELCDADAYVALGEFATLMPELTEARETRASMKTRQIGGSDVNRFLEMPKSGSVKIVVLK